MGGTPSVASLVSQHALLHYPSVAMRISTTIMRSTVAGANNYLTLLMTPPWLPLIVTLLNPPPMLPLLKFLISSLTPPWLPLVSMMDSQHPLLLVTLLMTPPWLPLIVTLLNPPPMVP